MNTWIDTTDKKSKNYVVDEHILEKGKIMKCKHCNSLCNSLQAVSACPFCCKYPLLDESDT